MLQSLFEVQRERERAEFDQHFLINFDNFLCLISDPLTASGLTKRKRGGRRPTMGHGLHEYTRRNGGIKMKIDFTPGVRRPKNYIHAAKLSSEVGIHIRAKMPLATHWTQYKKR